MGLMGRVGEMLRLEAQAVAVAVGASALALAGREIVSGIDLHPRLRGGHLHGDARLSAENGGGVLQRAVAAAQHEIVVIALGLLQLHIVLVDPCADGGGSGEVHGRVGHGGKLACGDAGPVGGGEGVGTEGQLLL